MFDLPVASPDERRRATQFRNYLLDEGFQMSQFSIYLRYCAGKEQVEALSRRIEKAVPPRGSVHLVSITDRQYENIVRYRSREKESPRKNPGQLALF